MADSSERGAGKPAAAGAIPKTKGRRGQGLLPSKSSNKTAREPQTHMLQTKYSTRVVTCKSAAEQEAEELEKLQQRSVGLSAQKEQKEKNHGASVEMNAERCPVPVADDPPNKGKQVSPKKEPEEEEEGSAPASSRKDERETLEKAKGKHTVPDVPSARYKFKAQKLNPRIFESGPILPKRLPVKPPTQPVGVEKQTHGRESKKKPEDEQFEVHSRPCPTKILEGVVGLPKKKVIPTTVPKSPAFAWKNRIRVPATEDEKEEKPMVIKAQAIPHHGVALIPKARNVKVCPFSFDTRDKERQLQKEKTKELQKGEVPKFKALPVPHFDTVKLPEKKVKNVTQAKPFSLETEKRAAHKAEIRKHELEKEQKQQKGAACFKARPNTVTFQEPFVPKKEKKSVPVQKPFQLATERRAKERKELEKKMAEMEAFKLQQLEEVRQQEEEEQEEKLGTRQIQYKSTRL